MSSASYQPRLPEEDHTKPVAEAAKPMPSKHKKTKRLSWTLGRKKARDEPYVADRNGKSLCS